MGISEAFRGLFYTLLDNDEGGIIGRKAKHNVRKYISPYTRKLDSILDDTVGGDSFGKEELVRAAARFMTDASSMSNFEPPKSIEGVVEKIISRIKVDSEEGMSPMMMTTIASVVIAGFGIESGPGAVEKAKNYLWPKPTYDEKNVKALIGAVLNSQQYTMFSKIEDLKNALQDGTVRYIDSKTIDKIMRIDSKTLTEEDTIRINRHLRGILKNYDEFFIPPVINTRDIMEFIGIAKRASMDMSSDEDSNYRGFAEGRNVEFDSSVSGRLGSGVIGSDDEQETMNFDREGYDSGVSFATARGSSLNRDYRHSSSSEW